MDNLLRLLKIMQMLRDPEDGCPWDIQQTFASIVPYTIEEVYEVADAIDQQDFMQLKDELGDLLLQIVYYTQMAREQNLFDLEDVAGAICDKLVRRHPHVFDKQNVKTKQNSENKDLANKDWERIKQQERSEKAGIASISVLNEIPTNMPQLIRAKKIQKRVASVGFDWQDISGVIEKVEEELNELKEAINTDNKAEAMEEELGDLLFSVVNLSRHISVNADEALRKGNKKFIKRFQNLEEKIQHAGKQVADCSLDELEQYWQQAKQATI
ncbi:MAG: nucleoside triphosphate pyrophosphohydrolase [Gammaproteobacteria bacterium]|nr:nucleoside triphosphate pyrophosphohydrolase [Gammaproteobacteria bacterium]